MKITNETYYLKTQRCRHCGAKLQIDKNDLYLSDKDTVFTCPCCRGVSGINYTFNENEPNIGTVREVDEFVRNEWHTQVILGVCLTFVGSIIFLAFAIGCLLNI